MSFVGKGFVTGFEPGAEVGAGPVTSVAVGFALTEGAAVGEDAVLLAVAVAGGSALAGTAGASVTTGFGTTGFGTTEIVADGAEAAVAPAGSGAPEDSRTANHAETPTIPMATTAAPTNKGTALRSGRAGIIPTEAPVDVDARSSALACGPVTAAPPLTVNAPGTVTPTGTETSPERTYAEVGVLVVQSSPDDMGGRPTPIGGTTAGLPPSGVAAIGRV